jgi:hypothetical protein
VKRLSAKSWKEWGPTLTDIGGKAGLLADEAGKTKDRVKGLGDEFAKTIDQARKSAADFETGRVALANLGAKQDEVNKLFVSASEAMKAMGRTGDPLYATFTRLAFATANWTRSSNHSSWESMMC